MSRVMYQLTEKELKKLQGKAEAAQKRREWADANKKKLGKRYGIECRNAGADALKGDPEYQRGIWQARIDKARGLEYSEDRLESAYNLGYYRGWSNYESDLKGGLVIPQEYLQEA
jgi:hypothetical protein